MECVVYRCAFYLYFVHTLYIMYEYIRMCWDICTYIVSSFVQLLERALYYVRMFHTVKTSRPIIYLVMMVLLWRWFHLIFGWVIISFWLARSTYKMLIISFVNEWFLNACVYLNVCVLFVDKFVILM